MTSHNSGKYGPPFPPNVWPQVNTHSVSRSHGPSQGQPDNVQTATNSQYSEPYPIVDITHEVNTCTLSQVSLAGSPLHRTSSTTHLGHYHNADIYMDCDDTNHGRYRDGNTTNPSSVRFGTSLPNHLPSRPRPPPLSAESVSSTLYHPPLPVSHYPIPPSPSYPGHPSTGQTLSSHSVYPTRYSHSATNSPYLGPTAGPSTSYGYLGQNSPSSSRPPLTHKQAPVPEDKHHVRAPISRQSCQQVYESASDIIKGLEDFDPENHTQLTKFIESASVILSTLTSVQQFEEYTEKDKKKIHMEAKKRIRSMQGPLMCHSCGCTETPEWRKGPKGPRTLCNACGLVYAKMNRKSTKGKSLTVSTTGSSSQGKIPATETDLPLSAPLAVSSPIAESTMVLQPPATASILDKGVCNSTLQGSMANAGSSGSEYPNDPVQESRNPGKQPDTEMVIDSPQEKCKKGKSSIPFLLS
ncbi:hypothetical protein IWQ62_005829 [Dispira parvispora]|uniref:GATA-type domain-containing protein n=1 Tax=Dispira parvispora TaxID=1520584 RepID=A0A9W8AP67_9FUNG|nr:hypothetical protein IWQ62_005829 [Dispira parvispora]